ncbi:GrpB family protein [Gorillibacterium sp. CAU 1737]|uniref:GrpB family protein n=1 Tax=Gorillibacterium sp. CAU 1737 TaxID=3140362 RepID=UPI0032615EDA
MGSTTVPGLIAKPTVDILVEVGEDCDWSQVEERLREAGWTCMSKQEEPTKKTSYNKGYTPFGFAEKVYHLHVCCLSDVGELYFRDYLLDHPEVAKDYSRLKESLFHEFEHNRDGYTEAKTEFIRAFTEKARAAYPDRYKP